MYQLRVYKKEAALYPYAISVASTSYVVDKLLRFARVNLKLSLWPMGVAQRHNIFLQNDRKTLERESNSRRDSV